jgi:hypothetical protein
LLLTRFFFGFATGLGAETTTSGSSSVSLVCAEAVCPSSIDANGIVAVDMRRERR